MEEENEYPPLSDARNREIYEREIQPRLFAGKEGVEAPTVAYVAGQSAAGKSTLLEHIRDSMPPQSTVVLQRDLLRDHFPEYKKQLDEYGPEGAKFSEPDTWKWYNRAIEEATRDKLNIVVESTLRMPDKSAADLAAFDKEGYRKEINVLAVQGFEAQWNGKPG